MRLFSLYLRKIRLPAAAFLAFAATFAASFYLYGLPLKAVLYPILFSLFLAAIFLAVDFIRTAAKYRRLLEISRLPAALVGPLPDIGGPDDAGYQAVIGALARETSELTARAEEQYREMVDYYTVWAHQIKMPITAMSLALQDRDSELASRLSSELLRISQYVEMVLAFLRLRSESSDYVFREYSLDAVIRRQIARFSAEFIDRGLSLDYRPVDRTVITDEKWLSFVVGQVLSNALKYTRRGGITLGMEGDTLYIQDTGIGIAPEDLPRIFERGYTGGNGREDSAASGIGLYLCRRICENLGVEIAVQSRPGRGTRVSLTFCQRPERPE